MSFGGFDFNKGLASLQGTVSELGTSITPFAKRTRRLLQEKLGNAGEVTALPPEYVELEARVDALKAFHQKVLAISGTYEHETYDYPPNIKESLADFGKTVQERVSEAAGAKSASELGSIVTGGGPRKTGEKLPPKTLNHAFSRALDSSAVALESANLTNLSSASAKLGEAEAKVGDDRLDQDEAITKVNAGFHTTLSTSISFASKARRNVHNARLELDAAKAALKGVRPEQSAAAQADVEKAEDEFVAAVEDAVTVMKNVLDTPEPVRGLTQIAQAQLSFYKAAAEQLAAVVPELERLQEEQEATYRESRS